MNSKTLQELITEETCLEHPTLIRWLRARLEELSGNSVKQLILTGKVWIDGRPEQRPTVQLVPGQRLELRQNAPRADRPHRSSLKILHLDPQIVVCEKPTGILTVPFEDDRDSLMDRAKRAIPRIEKKGVVPPLRAVHRIDKEASGLVVFARTVPAQRHLQDQFAAHIVERAYLALVVGAVDFKKHTARSILVPDRGDGLKGSTVVPTPFGKEAVTHFETLEVLRDLTLMRCRLETGRTHQIRIHLAEMGHPLLGEPVYIRDYRGHLPAAPRMMLHATTLGFTHPTRGTPLRFESPMPELMRQFLSKRGGTAD